MNSSEYINILDNIFSKMIPTELSYLEITEDGTYRYRQSSMVSNLPNIYFDIKKDNFLVSNDLIKNIKVLSKLKTYEDNNLISMTPTKNGYYFQVFNYKGDLVYSQSIKFYSLGKLGTWWAKRRFPELALKIKRF